MKNIIISVLVMAGVTYLIRMLPLVLFKKKITNIYIKSFMEYVPCVVLACMTFPAIFTCSKSILASIVGSVVAIFMGLKSKSLVHVATMAALSVFIVSLLVDVL